MATNPQAKVTLSADDSPLRQSLREMVGQFRDFGDKAERSVAGVGLAGAGLKSIFIGAAAALSGGAVAAFVRHAVDVQDEMSKMAQKAGVTTEQFSAMDYAARLADVSTEQLTKTYARLSTTLADGQDGQKLAVELFQRLKLDPKNLKDADELLLALAERFQAMPDGVRKTAFAVDVFGEKLGPGLIPLLNQGREGIEALRTEAAQLGVVIDTETGQAAEKFNDTLTTMGQAVQGAGLQVVKSLLPGLQAVADEFLAASKAGGTMAAVGRGIKVVFETIAVVAANVAFVFGGVGRELGAIGAQVAALMRGDWQGFRAISDAVKADGVRARAELEAFEQRVMGLAAGDGSPSAHAGSGRIAAKPPEGPKAKADGGGAGASSYMQYYEAMLAEEKRAYATLNDGREYNKLQELEYWRWLADNLQLTGADKLAFLRKTASLELEISRKSAQERAEIEADFAATAEKFALGKVDAEASAARMALDLGAITKAQLAGLEVQFEQQRYSIQASALQERLRLIALDPNTNPVEMARIKNELLLIEQQHQTKRMELVGQQTKEEGSFGNVLSNMAGSEASWNNLFNGIIQRTLTWQQAMSNIFASVGQAFMSEFVTKAVAGQAKGLALMLAQKLGFITAEKSADAAGAAATVAIKSAESTAVIGANAAEAASGAAASQAAIPVIGPYMALAAMGAMFAAVMALGGKSARGGYDIPRGVNPMTQLHSEEMVLPSPLANAVRQMAGDGAAEVPGGGGDGAPVHIHTTGGEFIHKRDLAKLLTQMKRNFVFVDSR